MLPASRSEWIQTVIILIGGTVVFMLAPPWAALWVVIGAGVGAIVALIVLFILIKKDRQKTKRYTSHSHQH